MGTDYLLTQLFQQAGTAYLSEHQTASTVQRAIEDISRCRTQQLGGLHISCNECGLEHRIYASCSNRNCPICPALKKEIWLERRSEELLPVKYYHLVFTLPSELNVLCMNHPREMYNILFRAAWQSFDKLMRDEKWCGAQSGMLAVLHTWGKNLSFHPHLHCIVPAGGLSLCEKKWVKGKKETVTVDVKDLSKVYRTIFKKLLIELWEMEEIVFRGGAKKYEDIEECRSLFACFEKDWVVYAKAPSTGAEQTLNYLSRYTHSVAISEGRVLALTGDAVHLQYKDYQDEDEQGIPKKKTTWLSHQEFMSRFVRHILPSGFHKIRYMGIWSSSNRKRKLAKCQALLGIEVTRLTMRLLKSLLLEKMGIRPGACPCCGSSDIRTYLVSPTGTMTAKPVASISNRAPPVGYKKAG